MRIIVLTFLYLLLLHQSYSQHFFEKGNFFLEKSQYDSAIYCFNETIIKNKKLDDSTKALTLIKLGKAYQLSQRYDAALVNYSNGLKLFQTTHNINGIVYTKISLAEFHRHLGEFKKAEKNINEVEKLITNEIISDKNKAYYYNRKAAILAEYKGSPEEVIAYSKKAIWLSKKIGDKRIEASSLNQIGYLYFNKKEAKALKYYSLSLKIYEQLNDLRSTIDVIKNIARYYQIAKEYRDCIQICNKGIERIKDKNWYFDLKDLFLLKMVSFYCIKDYKEAYENSRLYNEQYINFMNTQQNKSLTELQTKYEVEKKDNQIILETKKSTLLKEESELRLTQLKYIAIILILVVSFLALLIFAFFKIKKANKLLNHSITEKELLLKEVNHRVKNNMQMVASLLELQSAHVKDEESKTTLNEGISRIKALGYAHQQLYKNEDYSFVSMKDYLQKIVNELTKKSDYEVTLTIKSDCKMLIEKAQAMGFILNELIANSIKYAWESTSLKKTIFIEIKDNNGFLTFSYTDNGEGFPKNFHTKTHQSLGYSLIVSFVERQLRGKVKMYNQQGAITEIIFKKKNVV